ncbi:hypothetical protein [Mammaliicoccus sp. D-M17]|uniref:hypothetical protein n=1 Tax=Mammaliicoccus sp. D-M17 TaxID=2898677 RepID=UPI001EFB436E|nr:hypothetical protein [Mammaliicoccus sp. D-M17]
MKLILTTLTLTLIALYAYTKRYQRYARVQDAIDPPIDYESDKYKEDETWFSGMGRY